MTFDNDALSKIKFAETNTPTFRRFGREQRWRFVQHLVEEEAPAAREQGLVARIRNTLRRAVRGNRGDGP